MVLSSATEPRDAALRRTSSRVIVTEERAASPSMVRANGLPSPRHSRALMSLRVAAFHQNEGSRFFASHLL